MGNIIINGRSRRQTRRKPKQEEAQERVLQTVGV